MTDNVNHPKHYDILEGVEAIDIIKAILKDADDGYVAYCYGNVIKYILRAPNKNGVEDLKKARVYLDWIIEDFNE